MNRARLLFAFLCLPAIVLAQAAPATPARLQGLDQFIDQVREHWKVPGMAVGVVQDGRVVFTYGSGYRDLDKKLPVTTKTLFPIGSTSKSFTALALAILKDRGKIDWDDHVRKYIPSFELEDPVAAERMTLRDLLLHRSGLARNDLVWYSSTFTRKQLIERLAFLPMGKGFRNAFDYNNLGYMVAGHVAGEASGLGWEGMVKQNILDPLGMNATDFSDAVMKQSPDYSLGYDKVKGAVVRIPFKPVYGIGPAGGINSNLEDMLRYIEMLLAKGKFGDKQIVSDANLKLLQSAQIVMGAPRTYPELGDSIYGMGWVVQTYRGHDYVWHNGGIDGFYTLIALLPADHVGVVVLTNRLERGPAEIVSRNVFDRVLALEPIDWNQRLLADSSKGEKAEAEEEKKLLAARKPGTHPAHDLKDYAGAYEDPGYGLVTITEQNGALRFTLNDVSAPLEHFNYETFITPNDNTVLSLTQVRFVTGLDGNVDSVVIPLEPEVHDIVFRRVKPLAAGAAAP